MPNAPPVAGSAHLLPTGLRVWATLLLLVLSGLGRDSDETQGQPETKEAPAVRRVAPVAERRPAIRRIEDPTTAAEHPVRAPYQTTRTDRIDYITCWNGAVPIPTPFPHIAVHVKRPISIATPETRRSRTASCGSISVKRPVVRQPLL
jgi:hypothetical protein